MLRTEEDFLLEPGKVTPKEHIIVAPLIWFAYAFNSPREFAARLGRLGRDLIQEWNRAYKNSKPGHRLPNEKILALGERQFRNRVNGHQEKAQLRLCITNYMFVAKNQQSIKPEKLKLSDLRVNTQRSLRHKT